MRTVRKRVGRGGQITSGHSVNDASDKRRTGSGKAVATHVNGRAFHWEGILWREQLHLVPCPDDKAHALLGDNIKLLKQLFFTCIQKRFDGVVGGSGFFDQRLGDLRVEAEEPLVHGVEKPFHPAQLHEQVKVANRDGDRLLVLMGDVHVPEHELHQQVQHFVARFPERVGSL